jgi:hypothetical protein
VLPFASVVQRIRTSVYEAENGGSSPSGRTFRGNDRDARMRSDRGNAAAQPGVTARRDEHLFSGPNVPRGRTSSAGRLWSVQFRPGPSDDVSLEGPTRLQTGSSAVRFRPSSLLVRSGNRTDSQRETGWGVAGNPGACSSIRFPPLTVGRLAGLKLGICVVGCGRACTKGAIGPRTLDVVSSILIPSTISTRRGRAPRPLGCCPPSPGGTPWRSPSPPWSSGRRGPPPCPASGR